MAWLGVAAFILFGAGVIAAPLGSATGHDLSGLSYALCVAGAIAFVVAFFWHHRKGRDTSGIDQNGDASGVDSPWEGHGHHEGFDGGHGGDDGGDGGH